MLSLACDYRVMTDGSKRNTWLCMNEVQYRLFVVANDINHESRFISAPFGPCPLPPSSGRKLVAISYSAKSP